MYSSLSSPFETRCSLLVEKPDMTNEDLHGSDQSEMYIQQIVLQTLQHGGSASKPRTFTFLPVMDVWSFPKYPSRTLILPGTADLSKELKSFIIKNQIFLDEEECWLGTWLHPQTGEYYLDIATGVEDLEEAYQLALKAGQKEGRQVVAMFNARQNRTVYLREFTTSNEQR